MRKLQDGWYPLGDKGPMVGHVPGFVTHTVRDDRMDAFLPVERPEAPGAARAEEPNHWSTVDGGACYVKIENGAPAAIRFEGRGLLRVARVRQLAESFTHSWVDTPHDGDTDARMPPGVDIPLTPSPEQPTHVFAWVTSRGGKVQGTAVAVRVHNGRGYAHAEWAGRDNPKVNPNFIHTAEGWRCVGPTGELTETPAGATGRLQVGRL